MERMVKAEEMLCSANGVELYTTTYFHPSPRAIAVVAHSLTERAGQYDALVQALWNAEFSVYLYDWRHQVQKERHKTRKHLLTVAEAVEDLDLVVQQAKAREKEKSAFIVAHDEAAAICLSYCASGAASKVSAVVLFAPALTPPAARNCTEWSAPLLSVVCPRLHVTVILNGAVQEMTCRRYVLHVRVAREAMTNLPKVTTPLLILCGTEDDSDQIMASHRVQDQVSALENEIFEFDGKTEDTWLGGDNASQRALDRVVRWLKKKARDAEHPK